MFPEKIDLLAGMQARLPVGFDKSSEDLSFLDREVIPRLFAEMVALLAIVQAAAHVALSTTHFVSFLLMVPLSGRETYLYIFERAKKQLFYAFDDAQVGIGVFYGWFDPAQVVSAAFPEPPSEEPPQEALIIQERLPINEEVLNNPPVIIYQVKTPESQMIFELPPLPPPERPPTPEIVVVFHGFDEQTIEPALQVEKSAAPSVKEEIAQTFPMIKQSEKEVAEVPSSLFAAKDPYAEIKPPKEYREAVAKLITTLSRTSLPGLLFKQGDLRKLGERISSHHIHTLKFLECILGDSELKKDFIRIRDSSAKWSGFLWDREDRSKGGGAGGALDKLAAQGKIDSYLPGFAKALHADLGKLRAFAKERNWEGMLDYLMH